MITEEITEKRSEAVIQILQTSSPFSSPVFIIRKMCSFFVVFFTLKNTSVRLTTSFGYKSPTQELGVFPDEIFMKVFSVSTGDAILDQFTPG